MMKQEYSPFKSKTKSANRWRYIMQLINQNDYRDLNPNEKIVWLTKTSLEIHNNEKQTIIIDPLLISYTDNLQSCVVDFIEHEIYNNPDLTAKEMLEAVKSSDFRGKILPVVTNNDQTSRISEFRSRQGAKALGGNVFQFFIDIILREMGYISLRPKEIKKDDFGNVDHALTKVVADGTIDVRNEVFLLFSSKRTLKERHSEDYKYTLKANERGIYHGMITLDNDLTVLNNAEFKKQFHFCFVTDDVYNLLESNDFFYPISFMPEFISTLRQGIILPSPVNLIVPTLNLAA